MNNALTPKTVWEWLETSSKENDHMEKGTLTEVTDSYTEEAIAYIVPLTERSEKGLYEIKVLWHSDKCIERTTAGYRTRRQKKDIIYITAATRPQFGHSTIVTPFVAIGKGHICIPYHNLWIGYFPVAKKKLPMFLGLSKELDAFIAKELKG
jgi:hypothetical protein